MNSCKHITKKDIEISLSDEDFDDQFSDTPDYGRHGADGLTLCPYCEKPVRDIIIEQAEKIEKLGYLKSKHFKPIGTLQSMKIEVSYMGFKFRNYLTFHIPESQKDIFDKIEIESLLKSFSEETIEALNSQNREEAENYQIIKNYGFFERLKFLFKGV